jgi:hypothetical protein
MKRVATFSPLRVIFKAVRLFYGRSVSVTIYPVFFQKEACLSHTKRFRYAGTVFFVCAFFCFVGAQDLAFNKPATASSGTGAYAPSMAVDGNPTTRWGSAYSDPQWIGIDLGSTQTISAVKLVWEGASALNYTIDLSDDGSIWMPIATKTNMAVGARTDNLTGLSGSGRYIRMNGALRTTIYGYSLYSFEVYGQTGITLPGRIQAEDYKTGGEGVGYHDGTVGNSGGAYKPADNVDIQVCADAGAGFNIGWTEPGEWLAYDVKVPSTGLYKYTARVASGIAGAKTLKLQIDGVDVPGSSVSFTDASGWGSWIDATSGNFTLASGNHELRFYWVAPNCNVNWIDIISVSPLNVPPVIAITSPADNAHFTDNPASVTMSVDASDVDGAVNKVDFYDGIALAGTVSAVPYHWTFALTSGNHTLTAIAIDDKSAADTGAIAVSVGNYLPTVSITSPTAGATFIAPANVSVTAIASDADGSVTQVALDKNGDPAGAVTVPPYTWMLVNLAAGAYTLTATATDNLGADKNAEVTFTVAAVPAAPVLSAPVNNAADIAINPSLQWNAVSGAETYRAQVSTDNAFTSTVIDDASLTVTNRALSGLSSSTTYFWRVNAANAAGTGAWSTVYSFTTAIASQAVTVNLNPAKDAYVKGGGQRRNQLWRSDCSGGEDTGI